MNRRDFLRVAGAAALAPGQIQTTPRQPLGLQLVDVTAPAGLTFRHTSGAYGAKLLPETMGPGCAFLDYDRDGWLDVLLVNGMDWPGHVRAKTSLRLYRNNRNGTFTDVTRQSGLDVEMYGMGVTVGDFDNDGWPDVYVTAVGQSRLFRNTGKGAFVDITNAAGLGNRQAFSTSAMWVDVDRDGRLDLFVCNYVRWAMDRDVFCSADGRQKSYCTPEAFRGDTCWLFRNNGDGTFTDITATSGIFDSSSKSLGVTLVDVDGNGWPDLFVANDTQPNKLYRNQRNGTFKEGGVAAGVAFSADGRARAGMGVDTVDLDGSGQPVIAVTNFDNEMLAFFRPTSPGLFRDAAVQAGLAGPSRSTLGFGCAFADLDLDGSPDLVVVNGHIDDTVRNLRPGTTYAQPPHLFHNQGDGTFRDAARDAGASFAEPMVGRGLAVGDFDNDGDLDLLVTTNNGACRLLRNDVTSGHRSVRFRLVGTRSNRDGIGAVVRIFHGTTSQSRVVHTGGSYLSHSDLAVTFGVGRRDRIDRVVIAWPSGRLEDFPNLATGRTYACTEGRGVVATDTR